MTEERRSQISWPTVDNSRSLVLEFRAVLGEGPDGLANALVQWGCTCVAGVELTCQQLFRAAGADAAQVRTVLIFAKSQLMKYHRTLKDADSWFCQVVRNRLGLDASVAADLLTQAKRTAYARVAA